MLTQNPSLLVSNNPEPSSLAQHVDTLNVAARLQGLRNSLWGLVYQNNKKNVLNYNY